MGAFFTNVQVHTGGRAAAAVRAAVLASLRRRLDAEGFEALPAAATAADADADRTILVGPAGPEPWIAVFDEATEGQREAELDRLAAALSQDVGGASVGVLVHDSDVLALRLFRDGRLRDGYTSHPDYGSATAAAPGRRAGGDPARWRDLLRPGATPEHLGAALAGAGVEAEARLREVGRLVGWSPRWSELGYAYLTREDAAAVAGAAALTRLAALRFRARAAPAAPARAAGPPRLLPYAQPPALRQTVGAPLQGVAGSGRSVGGPGTGLLVVVWGEAPRRGLIRPTTAQLVAGIGGRPPDDRREQPFAPREADGAPVWYAAFPDVRLPAGEPDPATRTAARPAGRAPRRAMDAVFATLVHVNVLGAVLRAGRGVVHVGLVPAENREAGQAVSSVQIIAMEGPAAPAGG